MVNGESGAGETVPDSALPATQKDARNDARNAQSDPTKNSIENAEFGGVNGGVKLAEFGGVKNTDDLDDLLSELRTVPAGAKLYQKEHRGNFYAVYRWFENRVVAGAIKRVRAMRYVAPVAPKRRTKRTLTHDDHKKIKSNSRAKRRDHRRRG